MKKKNVIILVVSIVVVILMILGVVFIGIPVYLNHTARKALSEVIATNSSTGDDSLESMTSQLEDQEKEMFNQRFTAYETSDDETTTASTVLALFSIVANSNSANPDRIVDVNGTTITSENLSSLKSIITNDMKYKIKCVLDDDGYVKTIELRYTTE